jgi:hypothetical protein
MMLLFCHSEPPKAAKNLAFSGNQETLRLRLRVIKWAILHWEKPQHVQLFMTLCIAMSYGSFAQF